MSNTALIYLQIAVIYNSARDVNLYHSSSTISCGVGFRFTEFACDPSSSRRTSEPSNSLLSQSGCPEYAGGVCGVVLAAFRFLKNRSIIAPRISRAPTAAPTPMPAFAPVDRPVFVMAAEVGEEVGDAVAGVPALVVVDVVVAGRS